MRTASPAFATAIDGSYRLAVQVDVLFNREVITDTPLSAVSGSVTFDRNRQRYAMLSNLTIADPARVPVSSSDIITPFGYELRVSRGVVLPTGPEVLPLGTFPIQTSQVSGISLLSSITGEDRSKLVSDAGISDDYEIAGGTNIVAAIADLISDGVPDIEFLFPSTTFTTAAIVLTPRDDRWAMAQKLAKSIGYELVFDGLGRCIMRPDASFADEPSFQVATATNMIDASVKLDRGPAFNRVDAVSANPSTDRVYRGVAIDDDPSSPTFYDGPFGRKPKPRPFASPFINSDEQAASAAASLLASNLGVARSVDLKAVPDPRWEPGDVGTISHPALGLDDLHIIDSMSIGIGPSDPVSMKVRSRQAVAA